MQLNGFIQSQVEMIFRHSNNNGRIITIERACQNFSIKGWIQNRRINDSVNFSLWTLRVNETNINIIKYAQ